MRAYVFIILLFCTPAVSREPTDRTIQVADKNGEVLTQIRYNDKAPLRLTDQLGQSFTLRAANPVEGFIELTDARGESVVLGRAAGVMAKHLQNESTKNLIMTILFQVAKGIAVVVALLMLRSIIRSIGKETEDGMERTKLLVCVTELEEELEKLKAEAAPAGSRT